MHIFHESHATSTEHEGVIYEADKDGIIDVPQDVGETFLRRPGWHAEGWTPELTDEEKLAAEDAEKQALRDEVDELKREVAALKRNAAKPARR